MDKPSANLQPNETSFELRHTFLPVSHYLDHPITTRACWTQITAAETHVTLKTKSSCVREYTENLRGLIDTLHTIITRTGLGHTRTGHDTGFSQICNKIYSFALRKTETTHRKKWVSRKIMWMPRLRCACNWFKFGFLSYFQVLRPCKFLTAKSRCLSYLHADLIKGNIYNAILVLSRQGGN